MSIKMVTPSATNEAAASKAPRSTSPEPMPSKTGTTAPRPRLPPLASLALPGSLAMSDASTSAAVATEEKGFSILTSPSEPSSPKSSPPSTELSSLPASSTAASKPPPRIQAAIYEALRRRWSASSASELQMLADAAAQALKRNQQAAVAPSGATGTSSPRRPKRKSEEMAGPVEEAVGGARPDAAAEEDAAGASSSSDDDELRDRVSPLSSPAPAKRRRPLSWPSLPSASALSLHRSAILRASRQHRTFSLDETSVAGAIRSPDGQLVPVQNRRTAFENLLSSLAAVKDARLCLRTPPRLPRTFPPPRSPVA
ncbi:hypothetical protein BMF94_6122 [Rhodotorula taiwanensis]|uniref:Uncharacterized protein n=1 Tax=Rhodotorula taiwanensis TaxID=741276 RepID=A0A2S5B2E0_9BASI|nr:hypothetical protein BMF94_6122 [Rhodotorula taiwanensis]